MERTGPLAGGDGVGDQRSLTLHCQPVGHPTERASFIEVAGGIEGVGDPDQVQVLRDGEWFH